MFLDFFNICYDVYMKISKILIISVVVGLICAVVATQLNSSKYPPCAITERGAGIATYGCTTEQQPENYACKNERSKTRAMAECVRANYYRYKTVPFGFKQEFGQGSNKIDSGPSVKNAAASYASGFALSFIILAAVSRLKKPRTHNKKSSDSTSASTDS